ncbi:Cell division control protein 48-like protein B [Forsythia ovata]|uniref:Cell division control protein 48-like protein B n=1 Tax=Forsythia ovata TaxID=205694 RepID=A0ABD1WAE6_9LAMI
MARSRDSGVAPFQAPLIVSGEVPTTTSATSHSLSRQSPVSTIRRPLTDEERQRPYCSRRRRRRQAESGATHRRQRRSIKSSERIYQFQSSTLSQGPNTRPQISCTFRLQRWPSNLLLYGAAGTGKTSLVRAVVQESGAHLVTVRSYAKDIEKTLREAFAQASSHAKSAKPSVIFIDEIDVLCSRLNSRREQDTRVVSLLGVLMDSHKSSPTSTSHFVVVASTHRVNAIDPALRRPGRFDAEIEVRIPNVDERFEILKLHTKKLHLDSEVDLQTVAVSCNGYVGADLLGLCRMATYSAENRSSDVNQVDALCTITMDDWKHAMSVVKPSITRGVTEKIPEVSWDDIGGLKDLKKKLQQAVEWPLKYSSSYSRLGISPPRGILLHGPPGCSKTTLAKAIAHVTQASFFSLSPADLYNKYVGEGEAMLRDTFRRARLASPSIIFFDDADAIGAKRGGSSSGNSRVGDKILSTLLTEMDGLEESKGVLVLAATNLLDAIDPALKRPGRFDEESNSPR